MFRACEFDGFESACSNAYINVGGVLYKEFAAALSFQLKMAGVIGSSCFNRSSRTIYKVIPEGPKFFCAPAKTTPN